MEKNRVGFFTRKQDRKLAGWREGVTRINWLLALLILLLLVFILTRASWNDDANPIDERENLQSNYDINLNEKSSTFWSLSLFRSRLKRCNVTTLPLLIIMMIVCMSAAMLKPNQSINWSIAMLNKLINQMKSNPPRIERFDFLVYVELLNSSTFSSPYSSIWELFACVCVI